MRTDHDCVRIESDPEPVTFQSCL